MAVMSTSEFGPVTNKEELAAATEARRGRVPFRDVRGHARQALRQDGARFSHRWPDDRWCRLRRVCRRPDGPSPRPLPTCWPCPTSAPYMAAPWQPGLGIIQCDPHVLGEPWPFSPRVILRRQLFRKAASGNGVPPEGRCGVEYFLVRRSPSGGIEVADPYDQAKAPCYDARALTRMYDHLTTVSKHLNTLGWSNYANDHEDANGQFKQELQIRRRHDDRRPRDRLPLHDARLGRRVRHVGHVSMPKPFSNLTGNGLHMHLSLWDEGGHRALRR